MMKQVYRIDSEKYYLEPVVLSHKEPIPVDCREETPPNGLFRAKRNSDDTAWIEGASQDEIEALKNAPQPLSEIEQLKKQQTDLMFELMLKGVL